MTTHGFRIIAVWILFAVTAVTVLAEGEPLPIDQQIEIIKRQIQNAEERVEVQTQSVLSLDRQVESQINDVITLLTTIKDSPDSKTRVTALKKDIIEGLERSIAFYRQRRTERIEALRTGYSREPNAQADQAMNFLEEKMDKRVDQILQVTASLTDHTDWKRYEDQYGRGDTYRNDDEYSSRDERVSNAYDRHERAVDQGEREKQAVSKDLKEDSERLRRETDSLRQSLANARTDEARQRTEDQIRKNEETLAKRREQSRNLLIADGKPAKPVSQYVAFETEKTVDDLVRDIQRNHRELVQLASERKNSAMRLKQWQERLRAAQAYALAQQQQPAP